jgi:ketosteroid isomerase-like protein
VATRHVNVVERLFGLSKRCAAGDPDALSEVVRAYHEDARLEGTLPGAEDLPRGVEAIRAYFEQVVPAYEEWQVVLDYVQDFGDRVLALGALRSIDEHGVTQERAVGWIFTFRDDKIDAVVGYPSYGAALRAATAR